MHGYPDMIPPPGCRPLPPGPPGPPGPPPPHDMMYGPPPDHLLPPGPPPDGEYGPPPGAGDLYPGPGDREADYTYLDTSDDSGRHTGPDQPSP